jgi:hypothetical protein
LTLSASNKSLEEIMALIQNNVKSPTALVFGYIAVVIAMLFSGCKEFLSEQPDWSNLLLVSLTGIGVTRIAGYRSAEFYRGDPWLFRILTLGLMLPAIGMIAFTITDATQRFVIVSVTATVVIIALWKFEKDAYRKTSVNKIDSP